MNKGKEKTDWRRCRLSGVLSACDQRSRGGSTKQLCFVHERNTEWSKRIASFCEADYLNFLTVEPPSMYHHGDEFLYPISLSDVQVPCMQS